MPDVSIHVKIGDLGGALQGVTALLGAGGSDSQPGTGMAGGASEVEASPADRVESFGESYSAQVSATVTFDSNGISSAARLFGELRTEAGAPPTAALEGFAAQIGVAGDAFSGGFVTKLVEAVEAVRGLVEQVPENPTAVVSTLLDQILKVLGTLNGPEAEAIQAWVRSLAEIHGMLMPVIEAAQQEGADAAAIVLDVFRRALESVLETFGYGPVLKLMRDLDRFPIGLVPPEVTVDVKASLDAVKPLYVAVQGQLAAGVPEVRAAVIAAATQLNAATDALLPVLAQLQRFLKAPLFQPGALEAWLRERLETALAVRVHEAQKIDDPFKALFDRIDAAIGDIDLGFVRDDVLGFFERTRTAIDTVDVPSLADLLDAQLDTVDGAVQQLQQAVTALLDQVKQFFDSLVARLRELAGQVGTFDDDGTFTFAAEEELRRVLDTARKAVAGDPANPSAPSAAASLAQFRQEVEGLLQRVDAVLDPMVAQVAAAKQTAVDGIHQFTQFVQDADVPAKLEALREKVKEVLDQLAPVDFAVVVDPVIGVIEENTEKLKGIDTSKLNDLLKQALAAALDVVISIDFSASISAPLDEQYAEIKALPAQGIATLQAGFEQAVGALDALSPTQLLAGLLEAFDVVAKALRGLNAAALLAPLDALHKRFLEDPLAELKPSELLEPVSEAYQGFISVFDDIHGADIIAPVDRVLGQLKAALEDFDAAGPVEQLKGDVATLKAGMAALRPSEMLQPLVADLVRLEAELDRFKPSVLFAPAAELATPLLAALEEVQQETATALFELFREPLRALDRLQPQALVAEIRAGIDALIAQIRALGFPALVADLKAKHFDLHATASAGGVEAKVDLVVMLDPEAALGPYLRAHDQLLAALEGLKSNVALPDLDALYDELRTRLLGMLPPYARAALDPETFKRVMRLADPTRFLTELDARYDALLARLVPIQPSDITGALDAQFDAVLAKVEALEVEEALDRVLESLEAIKGVASAVRVDFVAADIDRGVQAVKAVAEALDVARLFPELDALHADVLQVVRDSKPSVLFGAGLQPLFDDVGELVDAVDPRAELLPALEEAWAALLALLKQIDFSQVLSPLLDKMDELEAELKVQLRRTEQAFDRMLGAGKQALGGSSGGSISASIEVSF
jgi:hypothetical protein